MKSFYKEQLDAFIAANEDLADPVSLMAPPRMQTFIENRLKRAFEAGWNAAAERYHNEHSSE